MAASQRSLVQDQIADVTECSICTEIFTNPKILPCVHTFCLHCLETYGKDKTPGDQMVCPICRKEFVIPDGGFPHLPNNFFIGKVVEIGKLASAPTSKSLCALCSDDDEVLAELFCVDCEQNLCSRCGKGHKKSRFSQHHQIVELGGEPKSQELNLRNSYCDHHPGEMIKMFCYEDNVAICLICCVESHQSHRCVNVNKAAGEFREQIRDSAEKVINRLSECQEFGETLDKFKKEFQAEVLKTEGCIRDASNKVTKLIEQHTELLVQNLKLVKERNIKAFEITAQDFNRFKVMIDSFSRYSEELLTRGSPVDICRAVNQMLTRAHELETLPANCSGGGFCCDTMVFHPLQIDSLYGLKNAVGDLAVTRSSDWLLKFDRETFATDDLLSDESTLSKGSRLSGARHVEGKCNPKEMKSQSASSNSTIIVWQIPHKLDEDLLRGIFESKRKGGGKIDDVNYNQENGTAVITFEDPNVAASFVEKEVVDFKGQRMLVTKYEGQTADTGHIGKHSDGIFNTVKISGLTKNTPKEMISMYFENKKRSGGGSLRVLEHQKEQGKVVIKFDHPEDALEVCRKTHALSGARLKISALEMPLDDVKSCAIEVKGFGEGTTEDLLALHFEFRSGVSFRPVSGTVEKVFLNKQSRTAIVVFKEAAAVLGVMMRRCHVLNGATLEVNVLEAAPPPPLLLSNVDTKRLLAKRLPPSVTKENLMEYLNPVAQAKMVGWTQAVKPSTALLDFSSEPDYLSIRRLVCSKPFLGKMISIRRVPLTSSIIVTGIPSSITSDFVEMYFQNPRNGGTGEECIVKLLADKGTAIVELDRPDVIHKITSKRHQFEKNEVNVEPYYPWLGVISASECSSKVRAKTNIDDIIWKKENVPREIWNNVRRKIQEHALNKSKLCFASENDQCEIQYMGLKKDTDEFESIFKKIKQELQEEMDRKKKRISEFVTNLKAHQLDLIRTAEFKNKLRHQFPDLEFEVKQTEVILCGMPDVVRKVRLFILEKVSMAFQDSFEISESMGKVFAKDDSKPYLTQQILNNGISASWTCNDRSIVVYAFEERNVKEAVDILKEEVVERHIQLNKAIETLVKSSQWNDFIKSLYTDNKSLEVAVMGSTLVAACTRNVAEDVLQRLNGFINKHAILEKVLPMDQGVVDVIRMYMKGELHKIGAELKESSGSIDTLKDEPGFIIMGNEAGVGKALKKLLKLTDNITMYDHDIDRPGIPAYFYSNYGKEVLRGIQINHKVSIQLDNTQSKAKPQAKATGGAERCRVEVRRGQFMILMSGDITKCNVDAIVSAASEDLDHIGGVAAAIAEAAGPDLEDDCWVRVKLYGPLLPGQACVTRAGKLPCKKVIHAVGPRWSGGHKHEETTLAMTVDSSLDAADEEGLKSIAMPSISPGIFLFPIDRATDIIVDAVKSYLVENSSTTVREVFFIDNDPRAVASLERKLKSIEAEGSLKLPEAKRKEDEAGATQRTGMVAGPHWQSERRPEQLDRIILSIYALSRKAIDDVLKGIEKAIKEYIIDKVLDSQNDQENIAKLNDEQVKRIKAMTNMFPVQIQVETGRLKRIRIRGAPMEVTSVMNQVDVIFQEAQEKELKNNEAHWEYEDGSDFEKYPDEINAIIERAYRDKKPYAEWKEHDAKYRLTFHKMVVGFVTKSGTPPVKVRRLAKDMNIPANWEAMEDDEVWKRFQLNASDQECKDVEKAVRSTAQTTVNQIVKFTSMAKSHQSSVQDQMADVTECCICTDVYTNPKLLPCIHTFCLQCLEKYGTGKKTGDQMACPLCRSEFSIPDGGLCNLPNNFFIDKMLEIRKLSEASTIEVLCGTCPDEDRMKAKMFCFQCEQNLCERCCVAHSKMKLCQNHQVVEIGNKLKS